MNWFINGVDFYSMCLFSVSRGQAVQEGVKAERELSQSAFFITAQCRRSSVHLTQCVSRSREGNISGMSGGNFITSGINVHLDSRVN